MIAFAFCLLACLCGWAAVFWIMSKANPQFRSDIRNPRTWLYALAVFGLMSAIVSIATSCRPASYAERQAAERPECRDQTLAVFTAECVVRVKATPNVTEKNKIRAECLERVQTWEECK